MRAMMSPGKRRRQSADLLSPVHSNCSLCLQSRPGHLIGLCSWYSDKSAWLLLFQGSFALLHNSLNIRPTELWNI